MSAQSKAGRAAVTLALLAVSPLAAGASPIPVAHPREWPAARPPLPTNPALEARITRLMARMTLAEKVGQTIQADISTIVPADLAQYPLGSILAGGNSGPYGNDRAQPANWLKLARAFNAASAARPGAKIPLLIGIDALHGDNNIPGSTLFPHNIGLGAAHDPDLLRAIGATTAAQMRATGQNWAFAPCLAVAQDPHWGRTYESFSEDPAEVARDGAAVVEGLQGAVNSPDFLTNNHVVATAKHFLGDGGTFEGIDEGDARISEAVLRGTHSPGYYAALGAGAQTVMASFSSWQGLHMHGNRTLLTGLLKQRMGFDGFVVSDWNGFAQLPGCTAQDCPASFNAGVDMFMAPDHWRELFANMLAEARDGKISKIRLDDAVRRILRVKFRAGLLAPGKPAGPDLAGDFARLNDAPSRALARRAVRESLVLLKNDRGVLPLSPHIHVLVAGNGANNLSRQAGGWSISWQGTDTTQADFPTARTIYAGIRDAVTAAGGSATLSPDGSFASLPGAAIVVFGEPPYAETRGDRPGALFGPSLAYEDASQLAILRRLRAAGIPTVAVLLSGRPLDVSAELAASDGFVAAWLPGSEGEGVADLLFRAPDGTSPFNFTGRLPFTWRNTPDLAPSAKGVTPPFPLGFGLSYGAIAPTVPSAR